MTHLKNRSYVPITIRMIFGKPGLFTLIITAIGALHCLRVVINGSEPMTRFFLLGTFITLLFLFSIGRICENIPFAFFRNGISLFIFFFLCGMNAYRISNGVDVDYALITNNIAIGFSSEALTVITSAFTSREISLWIVLFLCVTGFFLFSRRAKTTTDVKPLRILIYLTLAVIILFLPVSPRDELSAFIRGGIAYGSTQTVTLNGKYPLLRDSISATRIRKTIPASKKNKPNIFIIMVESFNANFTETKNSDGIEFTPYFNSLIKQGIYIDRFYGNSIQTCKGQEATLFSIIPSMNGKLFVTYPNIKIKGFPALLARKGYQTHFFQAYHSLAFDNTRTAMQKAGFSEVHSFAEFKREEDSEKTWGWGIEDGTFYERFFEYLDSSHTRNPNAPVFATLATVGTHIPCTGMPADREKLIRDPKNIRERYINALHLSDSQLAVFFRELTRRDYLSNSIVIITADHSFPMKEHDIYNNEICRYEESFRIPFLMIWKGALVPERVSGRPYSQIDIGPTICDLLGIRDEKNSMHGISIFDRRTPHPIELVQPYNGVFLEAVSWPYKYVKHLRTKDEFVYNLSADPTEKTNLLVIDPARDSALRALLEPIFVTQKLLEENRITH
ncbi:MAG TPA: sulfatase-like hydrolase/transferase [Spirochaetota bacterium]